MTHHPSSVNRNLNFVYFWWHDRVFFHLQHTIVSEFGQLKLLTSSSSSSSSHTCGPTCRCHFNLSVCIIVVDGSSLSTFFRMKRRQLASQSIGLEASDQTAIAIARPLYLALSPGTRQLTCSAFANPKSFFLHMVNASSLGCWYEHSFA